MTYTMQKLLPTIIMKYDLVNNILGITNTADPQNIAEKNKAKLGGAYSHSYVYDDINRLISADGKAKTASYRLDMTYGIMGEPLTKKQKVDSSKVAQSYAFAYLYEDSDHPTAPSQIGHNHYTYDANGNPTLVENDSLNTERRMYWDEDNRLMVLSDNGKTSRYTYNAAGERIVKSHGDLEGVYVNGAPQGITFHETEDYTIYPAPIITVTKNRFTKHYFIGDKRIASKLGTGKFSNVYGISSNNVTAGQKDYAARMLQIEKQREDYYRKLGTPPGVPTMKGATADPDNTGYGYNTIIGELGDHSVPEGWMQRPKFNDKGDVPGPPIQWQKPEDPDNAQPGYGYVPTDTTNTEDIFFYHSDHLGSTSYITDAKANITQFDAYLPYGELLVDEHSSSEEMPYKFNGKEFDEETGLYYYGARYMDPKISMWLGVDPLMEKYPNVNGYCYTMDNPIKYIDPNGKNISEYDTDGKKISNLGGDKIDFIHQKNGDVQIIDKTNNHTNIIKNGSKYIKNYTQRNSSVSWNDITKEFMTDSGPVYSLFSDFSNKGEGAFGSLESYNSIYGLAARSDVLRSNKSKNTMAITTLYANPLSAGFDPWEQMIGEANISWYNLGNDVLFMLVDSKSNTSLYYHIPFINNKKRGQDGFGHGNTYQTYIWLETKKDIKQKNDFYLEMLQKRMEAIHR